MLPLLARINNQQVWVFRSFGRRSPYRFHCQGGQLRYRRHAEAESRSGIVGIGRSATKKAIRRVETVLKFCLTTVSVGDPTPKRQLPFGCLSLCS